MAGEPFWLGKDHQIAVRLTQALDLAWDNEQSKGADGKKCWSNQSIYNAFQMVGLPSPVGGDLEPMVPVSTKGLAPVAKHQPQKFKPVFHSTDLTLHKAIDLYSKMRVELLDVRTAGLDSSKVMASVKKHLPDMVLHSIGAPEQKQLTDQIKARPPRKNGNPITITTARKWVQELGAAFAWFSHPDSRIGWVPPYPAWREKFFISTKQAENIAIMAGEEDYGKVKPTFTLEQLVPIFKQATDRGRLYLLGGVCLGWTAKEFSTLKRDQVQVDENGDTYILDKKRSKTGVPMSFWVCPELAEYLTKGMNETPKDRTVNPQGLALMTRNRQGEPAPLVHPVGDGKYHKDTINELWDETVKRTNRVKEQVPKYPHSRLRKLGGQLVENITGNHGLSQMLLAHKQADVASTNYIGNNVQVGVGKTQLQRLWEAQREVHKALAPLFAAVKQGAQNKKIAA